MSFYKDIDDKKEKKPILEQGREEKKAIVITAPQEQKVNTPTIKDINEAGAGDDLHKENVYAENVFAEDELEIGENGSVGTNLADYIETKAGVRITQVDDEEISVDDDGTNTIITVAGGNLNPDKPHFVMFEIEGSGTHFSGNVFVAEYNESECFGAGVFTTNGQFKNFMANVGSAGEITIILVNLVLESSDSVKVSYIQL